MAATPTFMTVSQWSADVSVNDSTPGIHVRSDSGSSRRSQTCCGLPGKVYVPSTFICQIVPVILTTVGAKPRIDTAERRRRLGRRHHLAVSARAAGPLQAARGMVALHGTDPATVYLSLFARVQRPKVADIERALYDD